ncbi:hypothetical protein VNO78_22027 [Psophocarpus tetragonolobus]|uniref:Uncharacterized protein n=1 Tax=Psophocarpus tetragonolobus TaxID=3891 RepID=A0AAN9SE68_PSOTE
MARGTLENGWLVWDANWARHATKLVVSDYVLNDWPSRVKHNKLLVNAIKYQTEFGRHQFVKMACTPSTTLKKGWRGMLYTRNENTGRKKAKKKPLKFFFHAMPLHIAEPSTK